MAKRLPSYLKPYRKLSGLSQCDMAFMLGGQNGARFSRYENHQVIPSLRTAFALEAILRTPIGELFAGIRESVAGEVNDKTTALIRKLEEALAHAATYENQKKLRWLTGAHEAMAD